MANTAHLTLLTSGDGLRFSAAAGSGQSTLTDSGPGMAAPSPIELMLVALAACQAMDVISILRKKRQRVVSYSVDAKGERRDEHPRAFTRIELVHHVTGYGVSPEAVARAIELSHTKYCSVTASLDPAIEIVNRYEIAEAAAPGA